MDKSKMKLITKLFEDLIEFNATHATDLFFEYCPHIKAVCLRGYKGGWNYKNSNNPNFDFTFYYDGALASNPEKLNEVYKYMEDSK